MAMRRGSSRNSAIAICAASVLALCLYGLITDNADRVSNISSGINANKGAVSGVSSRIGFRIRGFNPSYQRITSNKFGRPGVTRRSVVEREGVEAVSSTQDEEGAQNTPDQKNSPISKPDGSPVALDDCIGNVDEEFDNAFLDEGPDKPPKWNNVQDDMFVDIPTKPGNDASYVEMFGLEPDPDPEMQEVLDLMEKMEREGTKRPWAPVEVKDEPPFAKEDIPAIDAEGCLDILVGIEPDVDTETQELMEEMDRRQGIPFKSEYLEEPRPVQSGEPLELLDILFTEPDPDPERDNIVAAMDVKNPMEEVPDFTPTPLAPMVENEQVILLRPDQIDSTGRIVDPELLASDPKLQERQNKAAAMDQKKNRNKSNVAPPPPAPVADAAAGTSDEKKKEQDSSKGEVEAAVAFAEVKAREASGDAKAKAAIAEAETRAKEAEEARVRAEKELAKLKAKMEQDKIERDRKEKDNEIVAESALFEESPLPPPPTLKETSSSSSSSSSKKKVQQVDQEVETGYKPPVVEGMPGLDDVNCESELGYDYEPLREMLRRGEFREADDWTRAKLVDIAGQGAQSRGWVYFAEVPRIPYSDMKSLDDLWRAGSGGKFGYSRQREIYARQGQDLMKMYEQMDWVTRGQDKPCPGCPTLCPTCVTFNYRSWKNNEFIYDINAKDGHLPLTSTLRGTKLLLNILNHPAIVDGSGSNRR